VALVKIVVDSDFQEEEEDLDLGWVEVKSS